MDLANTIGLVLKWLGVLLFFLTLLGTFEHPERTAFYDNLRHNKEVHGRSPVAKQLMKKSGFSSEQIESVSKVQLEDFRPSEMGRSIEGKVIAVSSDGQKHNVTELIKLRSWAFLTNRVPQWIAFVLILLGSAIESILLYKDKIT